MWLIVAFQGIVAIIAVVALIVSVTEIQTSREKAARDTCMLIRGLVFRATPREKLASATAFLVKSGLSDCATYAQKVVK